MFQFGTERRQRLQSQIFFRPFNKNVYGQTSLCKVPECTIECPIALQPDPLSRLSTPPFDSHLAGLNDSPKPCKRAGSFQPRPSRLTLWSKTDITGAMRADKSYLPLSDVAVTFRSGQRSKWHARQIYWGLLEWRTARLLAVTLSAANAKASPKGGDSASS